MSPPLTEEETKRVLKEALREWLDDRFAQFGKWTATALVAALLVALTYFILWLNGLTKVVK